MKKIIGLILIVSVIFTLSACNNSEEITRKTTGTTKVTEITYKINDSNINFEWMDEFNTFRGFQFQDGTRIFVVYEDFRPRLIGYDQDGNKLWEKNWGNIIVIDTYINGILFQTGNSVVMVDSEGNVVWSFGYSEPFGRAELTKLIETEDGGVVYQLVDDYTTYSFIKVDRNGNIEWENGPYTSFDIKFKDSTKILFEYRDDETRVVLIDIEGKELVNFKVVNVNKYFVTDNSFYLYDVWKDILNKYDLNGNLQYKLTNFNLENFLYEYEDQLVVSTETKITKINTIGKIAYEIKDINNWLCDYQFLSSYEDGSFLVRNRLTSGEIAYIKYDINGNVLIQKNYDKELTYVKTFSNGNILFKYNNIFENENSLIIFNSSLNQIYQSANYDMIERRLLSGTDELFYHYSIENKYGAIRISKEGEFYLIKRVEDVDQLIQIDQEGNEHYLFDVYTYNTDGRFERVIQLLDMKNNKFLFGIVAQYQHTILLIDSKGNIELQGEYIGAVVRENVVYYYIKTENEIKVLMLSLPDDVRF